MKKPIFLFALLLAGASVASPSMANGNGCPTSLNVSTGYEQSSGTFIPNGDPDDDWVITQTPAALSMYLGQPGMIIPTYSAYHMAGSTSRWMNYQGNGNGPDNWCANEDPWVYQNGFCVCGEGETPVDVTFDLSLHCDNWSEIWLMDANGTQITMLLSQVHQEVSSNFRNPADYVNTVVSLMPGSYSLALLQRNKSSVTAVTLDGTISTVEGGGILSGRECGFEPSLSSTMSGPANSNCGNSGDPGSGDGCPRTLNASTGYDEVNLTLIADNQADDDWILTQVPAGTSSSNVGAPGTIVPKHAAYHWAGTTSKYMNYFNGTSGPNNWYNSTLPFVYQNGFCLCGDVSEPVDVEFSLDLHCDNWAEVWLMDANGAAIQMLLSQTHQQITDNFRNPTDHSSISVSLIPGQYSLALLQRNGSGPTSVSLEAVITAADQGLLDGSICNFVPTLEGTFNGSTVNSQGSTSKPGFRLNKDGSINELGTEDALPGFLNTEVAVYPNPANNSISLDGFTSTTRVVMTDLAGRVVFEKSVDNATTIDISTVAPGVYMLQATDNEGHSLIEKLIVE